MTAVINGPIDVSLHDQPERFVPTVGLADVRTDLPPSERLMLLAREHGPLFAREMPNGGWTLFASSADLVAELADDTRFAKAINPNLEAVREFTGDGLFTAYNEEPNWAKAHNILLPAFALSSMRTYHPVMVEVAKRVLAGWDRHAADGSPVQVADDMTKMTLDTIGLAGFGYDFESFDRDEPHPFVQAMVRGLLRAQTLPFRDPDGDHTAEDAQFRVDAEYMAKVVDDVIAERRSSGDTSTGDLLGLMLGAPDPATGETLDDTNIRNQVITFLIAGHETTSGALSFALYFLAKNPTVLRLAQAEVDALWGDQPNPEPSYTDVGKLRFVRQVINEALRLWPTAPGFGRQATVDTLLAGRYPVRAGQIVQVLTPMLHRDPVWGDNVEEFDPARFEPEAVAARPGHAYKPFGTGERACIGMQFALHEATMLLGLLIHRYRLLGDPDYQLRIKQTLTLKPDEFTLTLLPRTAHTVPASVAAQPVSPTDLPARLKADTAVTVLHGSNLGTARDFARQLAELVGELGGTATLAPLNTAAGALPEGPLVVVAASYNGQPTDDAGEFVAWLSATEERISTPFAVLGIGDRNWAATYQRVPTLIDERLAELGGARLLPRGAADASSDLTGAVDEFTLALKETLLRRYGDESAVDSPAADWTYQVTEVHGPAHQALADRHELVPMTVTETGDLADLAHPLGRSKRFVRLALPEGVEYRTADHLAVLPVNDPALVEHAAAVLGMDLDTVLDIRAARPGRRSLPVDRPITVRDLLSRYVELRDQPTPAHLELLAARNPCPPEAVELRALTGDLPTTLELIEKFPALRGRLDWPTLLELLPAMRVRHYSISSSPATDPKHADLMISLLRGPSRAGEGTFEGVGSAYLHRVRPGDAVLARVTPCRESFRIGQDTPVIMVGAGTGLAPFRGAIADRSTATTPLPPALCYFGCDHPDVDYLHRAELTAADRAGAVSMRPAFSKLRENGWSFVQDRIAAEAEEIWALLEAGAKVYVCGDGNRMAPGVRAAFQDMCSRFTGADATAAQAWWDELCVAGRYVEDVYVSN